MENKLTRKQRRILLREALQGVTPAESKKPIDPVVDWLPELNELHEEGYSWQQLATATHHPKIALKLGAEALRRRAVATKPVNAAPNPTSEPAPTPTATEPTASPSK